MSKEIARWTERDLGEAVEAGGVVLADLRGDWCLQCGPQELVLARLAPELGDRVLMGSVDVGDYPDVVERHDVQTLPTLLLFREGRLHAKLTGFKRAPAVKAALREALHDWAG